MWSTYEVIAWCAIGVGAAPSGHHAHWLLCHPFFQRHHHRSCELAVCLLPPIRRRRHQRLERLCLFRGFFHHDSAAFSWEPLPLRHRLPTRLRPSQCICLCLYPFHQCLFHLYLFHPFHLLPM